MKRISSIWIAILGIVVGALIMLAYNAYSQKKEYAPCAVRGLAQAESDP